MSALHIRITGKVQGVFYRVQTKEVADQLDVKGWVRNLDDGAVEVYAMGSSDRLLQLQEWCKKGPPKATVTDVTVEEVPERQCSSFEILR